MAETLLTIGMPEGHLPCPELPRCSCHFALGEVAGGLFFGHSGDRVYSAEEHEELIKGLASHAAIALDNATLFSQLEREKIRAGRGLDGIAARQRGTPASQYRPRTICILSLSRSSGTPQDGIDLQRTVEKNDSAASLVPKAMNSSTTPSRVHSGWRSRPGSARLHRRFCIARQLRSPGKCA